jgi:anti-sigma factor ChrR (cupin superfamily)
MKSRGHRDIRASEIAWREGTDKGIVYAMFGMDEQDPTAPSIVLSKFEPGVTVAPHTHGTNYCEYVIEGEQTVGKTTFGAGDVRIVKGGAGYGPIKVGPNGCTVLIVFQDGSRAMTIPLPSKAVRELA